jgi:hypothetical protein
MGAAADCEAIRTGLLGQPVNSLTTLAFVVAGLVVIRLRPERRWIGIGLIATGIGSFLFHGPMPPGSQWAHDLSLVWLIALVAGSALGWDRWSRVPALAGMGLVLALFPTSADSIAVGITIICSYALLKADRSIATLGPLGLLAIAAILGRLGATGWPLCAPDSLLQTHGLWHLGAAVAATWWAVVGPSPIRPDQKVAAA